LLGKKVRANLIGWLQDIKQVNVLFLAYTINNVQWTTLDMTPQ
jgi:hypothetical protein